MVGPHQIPGGFVAVPLRLRLVALTLLIGAGCNHVEPGAADLTGNSGPFDAGPPLRLTLNPGPDRWPSWTADGRTIWYSYQDLERDDQDYCLAPIAATGGTRGFGICRNTPPAAAESLDVMASPAVRGERLAWIRLTSASADLAGPPSDAEIVVAPAATPDTPLELAHFPAATVNGFISFPEDVQWLDDSTLVFIGGQMTYNSLTGDTAVCGAGIGMLRIGAGGGTTTWLGGARTAQTVAVGSEPGELLFTRISDSRVYRMTLPDTTATPVFDFGGAGAVMSLRVAGGRMLAVLAPGDCDIHGGDVYLVEDSVAALVSLPPLRWRDLALRADGRAFAAAGEDPGMSTDDIYVVETP